MGVFNLKYRDTLPILDVVLRDPPPLGSAPGTLGPVHDLTNSTSWKMFIWLSDDSKLVRDMSVQGDPVLGIVRYVWVATDWNAASGGDPAPVGGLVVSPTLPVPLGSYEHRMEFEVIEPAGRVTFPNARYDILRIKSDIGQG